jgi:hypothetical protein
MDDREHPVIGFGLDYAGELIYCEAVMQDNLYEVLFDGKWMASIVHDDNMKWMLASGTILSDGTIREIGFRIESNYK